MTMHNPRQNMKAVRSESGECLDVRIVPAGAETLFAESFVEATARVKPGASIGKKVYVGPYAVVDGIVGDRSNVQDFASVGKVGGGTSVAHFAMVAGSVGNNNFVGFFAKSKAK